MKRRLLALFASPVFAACAFIPRAGAVSAAWLGSATGNFSDGTQWSGGVVPGTTTAPAANTERDVATFNSAGVNINEVITFTETARYLEILQFNNTGTTTIQGSGTAGTLYVGASGSYNGGAINVAATAGAVTIGGNSLSLAGNSNLSISNASANALTISATLASGTIIYNSGVTNVTAAEGSPFSQTINAGATLGTTTNNNVLSATSYYYINGTLALNGTTQTLPSSSFLFNIGTTGNGVATVDTGGGTLNFAGAGSIVATGQNGNTATTGASIVNGTLALNNGQRTILLGNGTAANDLTISSAITSTGTSGGITMTAVNNTNAANYTGTLNLTGTNTYTGATNILSGTLNIGATNAQAAATGTLTVGGVSVTVSSVATTFSGNLTTSVANANIGGLLTMTASSVGATPSISPNGSSIGALTLTPTTGTTFSTTAGTLFLNIATDGSANDQIIGSGTAKFTLAATTLDLGLGTANNAAVYGKSYTLFSGFANTSTATTLSITDYDTTDYTAAFNAGTGVLSFTAVAVPEPATWVGGALAMAVLLVSHLRRRARTQTA